MEAGRTGLGLSSFPVSVLLRARAIYNQSASVCWVVAWQGKSLSSEYHYLQLLGAVDPLEETGQVKYGQRIAPLDVCACTCAVRNAGEMTSEGPPDCRNDVWILLHLKYTCSLSNTPTTHLMFDDINSTHNGKCWDWEGAMNHSRS